MRDKIEYNPLTSILEIRGSPYKVQLGHIGEKKDSGLISVLYRDEKFIEWHPIFKNLNANTVKEIIIEVLKIILIKPDFCGYEFLKSKGFDIIEDSWKSELNKKE